MVEPKDRHQRRGDARLLTDPLALPDLRALARSPVGSRNAEMFTQRLLVAANGGAGPARSAAAR